MTSGDWHPRRKIDPARVKELYESGLSVSEVATELKVDKKTVYTNLRQVDVPLRGDKPPGRERQDTCGKGLHPLDESNTRVRVTKDGKEKRCCIKCEQKRWRDREQRKRDRRAEIDAIILEFIQEQADKPTS